MEPSHIKPRRLTSLVTVLTQMSFHRTSNEVATTVQKFYTVSYNLSVNIGLS